MKRNTFFLLSFLFSGKTSFVMANETSCTDHAKTTDWLRDRQINLDEIVTPSAGLIASGTPEEVNQKIDTGRKKLLTSLENPERFCKLAAIVEKSFCDQSKTLVDFTIQPSISKEMQNADNKKFLAAYRFFMPGQNQINTAGNNHMMVSFAGSLEEINSDLSHEYVHAMTTTSNLAICDENDLEQRKVRFGTDVEKLTFAERIAAPYNADSKSAFAKTIQQGNKRLFILSTIKKALDNPNDPLCNDASKKLIACLEKEVENFKTDTRSFREKFPKASSLIKIITQLFDIFELVPTIHPPEAQLLEIDAYIHQILTDYPKLFNYLFPELREWHMKRNPEYKKCLDEIAPERSSLTCKI